MKVLQINSNIRREVQQPFIGERGFYAFTTRDMKVGGPYRFSR
jgi:hypothetical protein